MNVEELLAILVFVGVYALITTEKVHRTVAAMVGASIILLSGIVPWESLQHYLDLRTLLLLAGMMVIVNISRESGLFEFLAIKTAKLSKGDPFKVLILFSIVTALVSAFLDNVTTVLLMTPMIIYITKKMKINPVPYLLSEIFASNIGGTATLIGDPPNIMIGSAANLGFIEFVKNMAPIAILDLLLIIVFLFFLYRRDLKMPLEKRKILFNTLIDMDESTAIRDRTLFQKSIIVILVVVSAFFLHETLGVEPAVVALSGAALLLLWSGYPPEKALEKVEWATLFFFGGLFLVVGGLVETGVIDKIADFLMAHIGSKNSAIMTIAWFSALSSAVVDNIPLTATMIPLIKAMGSRMDTYPLWWALSLGACLGGNGTAIGASANVVVLGIAYREGIEITFLDFLKVGILVLLLTVGAGSLILTLRYGGI